MKNPAIQRMVEQMMPEYFERRQRELDQVANIQKKIAELRMYGPRSREDLVTVFALKNGALKLPKGALYKPEDWYKSTETTLEKEYRRGLLNLPRFWANFMPGVSDRERMDVLTPYQFFGFGANENGATLRRVPGLGGLAEGANIMDLAYDREE